MPTTYRFLNISPVEYTNKKGVTVHGARVTFLACSGGRFYDTFTAFTSNSALINRLMNIEQDTFCNPVFDYKARLVDVILDERSAD